MVETRRGEGARLGAVVALAVLVALATGCASSSYARQREADRRLAEQVNVALHQRLPPGAGSLEAKASHGVVALLGEVKDEASRGEAEAAARQVAGVARVNNLILVVRDSSETGGSTPALGSPLIAARAEKAPAP